MRFLVSLDMAEPLPEMRLFLEIYILQYVLADISLLLLFSDKLKRRYSIETWLDCEPLKILLAGCVYIRQDTRLI